MNQRQPLMILIFFTNLKIESIGFVKVRFDIIDDTR
jgi:hypothetical protein